MMRMGITTIAFITRSTMANHCNNDNNDDDAEDKDYDVDYYNDNENRGIGGKTRTLMMDDVHNMMILSNMPRKMIIAMTMTIMTWLKIPLARMITLILMIPKLTITTAMKIVKTWSK